MTSPTHTSQTQTPVLLHPLAPWPTMSIDATRNKHDEEMEFSQTLDYGELKTCGANKHILLLNANILHKCNNKNTFIKTSTNTINNKSLGMTRNLMRALGLTNEECKEERESYTNSRLVWGALKMCKSITNKCTSIVEIHNNTNTPPTYHQLHEDSSA